MEKWKCPKCGMTTEAIAGASSVAHLCGLKKEKVALTKVREVSDGE